MITSHYPGTQSEPENQFRVVSPIDGHSFMLVVVTMGNGRRRTGNGDHFVMIPWQQCTPSIHLWATALHKEYSVSTDGVNVAMHHLRGDWHALGGLIHHRLDLVTSMSLFVHCQVSSAWPSIKSAVIIKF